MGFEPGGRADKYGNRYEDLFFAKLLLRMIEEKYTWIISEPLNKFRDIMEFSLEDRKGTQCVYQCKGSNGTHTVWSLADLRKYQVLQKARNVIEANRNVTYHFVSSISCGELGELCRRARTNSSPEEFIQYQLTNVTIKKLFYQCVEEFGLSSNLPDDVNLGILILSRCHIAQFIADTEALQDLDANISTRFTGDPATVRILLANYARETDCYGVKITANDVISYLKSKGHYMRDYRRDETVLHRIDTLNNTYWDSYPAIHNLLVHRSTTDRILHDFQVGHSIVLHGKPGCGKSGCLEELIRYCHEQAILYLAIKLDKHPPHTSADAYGQALGLPQSPVYCLSTLAAGKPCVLILDQLDALRWTSNHSHSALAVCKELISQAAVVNRYSGAKLSVVFAARTFDLEQDQGLRNLFQPSNSSPSLVWHKENVDRFTRSDLEHIMGNKYLSLSPRLQSLLLTPSSLYVWTKLNETTRENSISSVYELMDAWWKQIQRASISYNLPVQSVISCKDKLVEVMERRSVFTLPRALFADQAPAMELFISEGLLNFNVSGNSVSFAHQSFLDYFLTFEMLAKLYQGVSLVELMGERNRQTPLIRYRLLTVLQSLIESDVEFFIQESTRLLEAATVRSYFQCAVFEILGQCEVPTPALYQMVDHYASNPKWSSLIVQVVYTGHPQYVMRLPALAGKQFPSDMLLSLLHSISKQQPDFVTSKLRPFAHLTPEQDQRIFWALCSDANDDSDQMFLLRKELLQSNPQLFCHFWQFHSLIEQFSERAIDLFEILLESWPKHRISHLLALDENILVTYAKQLAQPVFMRLFPKICAFTASDLPVWPDCRWNSDFRDWRPKRHRDLAVRSLVELVKEASAEYAQTFSQAFLSYITVLSYPIPAVGHECVMYGVLHMPIDYADEVVTWFLTKPQYKLFVFPQEQDYLSYTAQLIQKFSPVCSGEIFEQLERYLCAWSESPAQMIDSFRARLSAQKQGHEPVYYAYWGHLQKTLLPKLSPKRMSTYAKELLAVVNRNPWISPHLFYCGSSIHVAAFVASPLEAHIERLSDGAWLKIIATPPEQLRGLWGNAQHRPSYVVSDHTAFASSLGKQAKRQPMRFAKLSLSYPENCFEGYVYRVLSALEAPTLEELDIDLVSRVIRRYGHSDNTDIAISIARVIEAHAVEAWPADIVQILIDIALRHPNPLVSGQSCTKPSKQGQQFNDSLLQMSINCARGCAIHAISALLWNHENWAEPCKEVIISACKDSHPAVRMAVMDCILFYYNRHREFAVTRFLSLIRQDLRILCAPNCWDLISREYEAHRAQYRSALMEACVSGDGHLDKTAASMLCAVAIYYHDHIALRFLLSHSFGKEQLDEICLQAAISFDMDAYHITSKLVLVYLMKHVSEPLHGFSRLFLDAHIRIGRDAIFLIRLLKSQQGTPLLHFFFEYLLKCEEDIRLFAHAIKAISESLTQSASDVSAQSILHDLVPCVIRLYDQGKNDPKVSEICLDIWDKLFMCNFQEMKPLSEMLDRFE